MSESSAATPNHAFGRALATVAHLAIGIAAAALLGLVVVQGWQVIARYVLNDSPSWTEPVTVLLLATAMSLGAAVGVHTNRHFGFYLLHDHMKPWVRRAVDVLAPLVIFGIGSVLAYWGAVLLLDGWSIKAAGADLPQSINYLPLSIGGALMALFALNNLMNVFAAPPGAATGQEGAR